MAEKIPLLQQLKTHVAVERNSSFALYLFDRAIARIEELEAALAEREADWLVKREEQWKRENPMGSTPIETTPVHEFASEAEYQSHRPGCRARRGSHLNRGACNCDVGTTRGRAKPEEQP